MELRDTSFTSRYVLKIQVDKNLSVVFELIVCLCVSIVQYLSVMIFRAQTQTLIMPNHVGEVCKTMACSVYYACMSMRFFITRRYTHVRLANNAF